MQQQRESVSPQLRHTKMSCHEQVQGTKAEISKGHLMNVHLSSPSEGAVVIPTEYKDGVVVRMTVARIQSSQ